MNYGLYISAAGAQTSIYRQDLFAGNLANIDTVAFKPDVATVRQRSPARAEDNLPFLPSNRLLEKLGAGPLLADNRVNYGQGPIQTTGNELDLAIEGDGFFSVLASRSGAADEVRYTRDGRLTLDSRGRLVLAASGKPVLDTNQRTISINPEHGPVQIDSDGLIRQDDLPLTRIALVDFPDRSALRKEGESLFAASPAALSSRKTATGRIRQHAIESSGVEEISTLMQLTSAARAVQANIGMMTYSDRMMEQAISRFARVN